jgi:hypothetical protein
MKWLISTMRIISPQIPTCTFPFLHSSASQLYNNSELGPFSNVMKWIYIPFDRMLFFRCGVGSIGSGNLWVFIINICFHERGRTCSMYKKKLQNEATSIYYLHFLWFTATTVSSTIGLFFVDAIRTRLTGRVPVISFSRYTSLVSIFHALYSYIIYYYCKTFYIWLAVALRIYLQPYIYFRN